MSFPYINAYQQFFDSSGAPLVGGTIEFRDPTSNALINSYPTADDADAQTNANANPLTLSSTGAAASGLFLEDGVAYKVILKDSESNTVATHDDVRCPIVHPWSVQTTAEASASVTPTNIEYPPGDIRRYGATGTADQTPIQNAIDVMFTDGGGEVLVPIDTTITGIVRMKTSVKLKGAHRGARITCSGSGQIVFDHATNDCRYSGLEFLEVLGSDASTNPVQITEGYEVTIERCLINGGGTSPAAIKIEKGNTFVLDNVKIINDASGKYSLHVDGGASFVNIVSIINGCRCDGPTLIDAGATGQALVIDGSDFSTAQTGVVLDIVRVQGCSIRGCYVEGEASGTDGLRLQQNVLSFNISGGLVSPGANTDQHIVCDATGPYRQSDRRWWRRCSSECC
jgi:hypothetical protein